MKTIPRPRADRLLRRQINNTLKLRCDFVHNSLTDLWDPEAETYVVICDEHICTRKLHRLQRHYKRVLLVRHEGPNLEWVDPATEDRGVERIYNCCILLLFGMLTGMIAAVL